MKINRFNMIAYGPFTDKTLDMSGVDNGLHMVFGQNEAGKSTALRALIAFLYGFEHIVQDDWLHATNKLAVGGVLDLRNGQLLNLTRYKRRKNDLINNDTDQPVEQRFLDQYLVSKNDFKNAYGISHDALRQGVETVLTSGGELGQTLFTATSGLNLLKTILADLDQKQKALFAPRARKAVINNSISQLLALYKQIRKISAKPNDWKHKKKEVEALEKKKMEIDGRLLELNKSINADTRARDAKKYISQIDDTEKELSELSSVPILSENFHERRVQAQVAMEESRQAQDGLKNELEEISKNMNRHGFDENIIASRERIEALADDIKVYRKEVIDSRNLRAKIHEAERRAKTALTHLGNDLRLDEIDTLRLSKPAENELRRLCQAHALLEQKREAAEIEIAEAAPLIKMVQDNLLRLGRPKQTQMLQGCLTRAIDHGRLDAALSEIQFETQTLHEQLLKDLAALGLWSGDLEAFETLSLPPEETIRRFESDLAQSRQHLADIDKEIQRLDQTIINKQKEVEEKTAEKQLPSPGDLNRRRELRNQGWRSIRAVWLDNGDPDGQFLSAFPESDTLVEAYEQSVKDADDTADLLRTEAEAVAIAQRLKKDIVDLKNENHARRQQRQKIEQRHQGLLTAWRRIWLGCEIEPYLPSEMLAWARNVGSIKRDAADYRQKRGKQNQLQSLIESLNDELSSALTRLGVTVPENIGHGALVDLSKSTIKQNEELREQRQDLAVRLEELIKRKDDAHRQQDQVARNMDQWLRQWQVVLKPLKLQVLTKPDSALAFLDELKGILSEYDDAKKNQSRIDAMARNREEFEKRVQEAVMDLASQFTEYEPDRAAEALKRLLRENLEQHQHYNHLEKERLDKKARLTKEQEKTAGNQEVLRQLCIEASETDSKKLPEIERRSRRKLELLTREKDINDRLAELAGGKSLQAFIDHVRRQDPDEMATSMEKNELEKNELQDGREALVANLALARADLEKFDGKSHAAGLAVQAEGVSGSLQTDVAHYIKLHLASQILTQAIERYRKENESPILEAASGYFEVMTRGAFTRLKADFDEKGNPVIKAVRTSDKAALALEEMSDGSRDQLFLSLRLGGLSRHLEANGGMPFIVDDVLVNFDDDRSSATLEALSGFANRTQIIFFTHHQHLVELAEKAIPKQLLCTHRL